MPTFSMFLSLACQGVSQALATACIDMPGAVQRGGFF